jgi:predicted HicB family RNase H-like nuclease
MASGQTRIRLPVDLHEALVREAAQQGVSLNTFMVAVLAGGIGFKLSPE